MNDERLVNKGQHNVYRFVVKRHNVNVETKNVRRTSVLHGYPEIIIVKGIEIKDQVRFTILYACTSTICIMYLLYIRRGAQDQEIIYKFQIIVFDLFGLFCLLRKFF